MESDSLLSLPWLALSEEWRNERRRNLHSFFPKKKTSVPYSSFMHLAPPPVQDGRLSLLPLR